MKNLFLRLSLFALFSFVLTNVSYAQTHTYGEGCLGTWCYVDVSLSDPTNAGEFRIAFRMYPNHEELPHRMDFAYVKWFA